MIATELRETLEFGLKHGWLSSQGVMIDLCNVKIDEERNLAIAKLALSAAKLSSNQVDTLVRLAFESDSIRNLVIWKSIVIDHDQRGFTTVQADGVVLNNNG